MHSFFIKKMGQHLNNLAGPGEDRTHVQQQNQQNKSVTAHPHKISRHPHRDNRNRKGVNFCDMEKTLVQATIRSTFYSWNLTEKKGSLPQWHFGLFPSGDPTDYCLALLKIFIVSKYFRDSMLCPLDWEKMDKRHYLIILTAKYDSVINLFRKMI